MEGDNVGWLRIVWPQHRLRYLEMSRFQSVRVTYPDCVRGKIDSQGLNSRVSATLKEGTGTAPEFQHEILWPKPIEGGGKFPARAGIQIKSLVSQFIPTAARCTQRAGELQVAIKAAKHLIFARRLSGLRRQPVLHCRVVRRIEPVLDGHIDCLQCQELGCPAD